MRRSRADMEKRIPFPAFSESDLRKIDSWIAGLDAKERERLRLSALKSQRYLRHEAARQMGLCK